MSYKKITLIFCLGIFLSAERNLNAQMQADTFMATGSGQSGTIQHFTIPACVTAITVTAYGAQGGASGGLGAEIQGTFAYSSGTLLDILVGQAGGSNDNSHGSGGGGSFVVRASDDTILVIAGGGGGHGASGMDATSNGWGSRIGQSGSGSGSPASLGGGGAAASGATGGVGCNNGSPAGGSTWAGGGGGFCGTGGTYNSGASQGGSSYLSGGLGGTPATGANAYGGFGGGSGAGDRGGGGGGYSGGAGGTNNSIGGGGGGSYNSGTNQANLTGINSGNGMVIISWSADSISSGSAVGNVISNIVCNGNATGEAAITINNQPGTPAFTYSWIPNVSSSDTAYNLTAGTYSVMVSGCAGGSASAMVTITQPGFFAPNPTINAPLCNGDTGSIIGGAIGGTLPYTFVFTPGGQVPAIYGVTSGTYSLNILDNHGCATSELITVSQPAAISTVTSLLTAPRCYGSNTGIVIASVTGGVYPYAYAWSPSGGTNLTASNLAAGNYVVTVTDANGCMQTAPITVTQPAHLGVIVNPPLLNLACNGDNNGVLGSGISGGIRPYTYAWSGGLGSDSDVMNLSAGTYSLTVTDAHGCITVDSALVIQPAPMNATVQSTFDDGHCTGSAWVTLSGGTPSYNYLWSAGSVTFYQNDLCAGESYCCTITDANGCQYNTCTIIQSSLGVGNISGSDSKIKVYPNPNNGQFTVESTIANAQWTVEVYNMLGEKLYTQASNGNSQMTIDMSSKPNGVYLYRVISNENGNIAGEGKIDIQR